MKKLVTALALCASFSAFAQVESANVVGYQTIPFVANQLKMFAFQWQTTGSTTGITLGDLTPDVPFGDLDEIQVASWDIGLNKLKFKTYQYFTQEYCDNDLGEGTEGWNDPATIENKNSLVIDNGSAVWIKLGRNTNLTAPGQVDKNDKQYSFAAGQLKMIGAAFPVAVDPNNCLWTGVQNLDEIQVASWDIGLNKIKFKTYQYFTQEYCDNDLGEGTEGWNDPATIQLCGSIWQLGVGTWVRTAQNVTMTMSSPL